MLEKKASSGMCVWLERCTTVVAQGLIECLAAHSHRAVH